MFTVETNDFFNNEAHSRYLKPHLFNTEHFFKQFLLKFLNYTFNNLCVLNTYTSLVFAENTLITSIGGGRDVSTNKIRFL